MLHVILTLNPVDLTLAHKSCQFKYTLVAVFVPEVSERKFLLPMHCQCSKRVPLMKRSLIGARQP